MTFTEKIKIVLAQKNMTMIQLAEKLGITNEQLLMKFKTEKFTEKNMIEIANALNCDLEVVISERDSNTKF